MKREEQAQGVFDDCETQELNDHNVQVRYTQGGGGQDGDAHHLADILEQMRPATLLRVEHEIAPGCTIALSLIKGKNTGKTLVCCGGVHGCEYNGPEALRRLVHHIDPTCLSGNLVIVPVMNPTGFFGAVKRCVPEDQINLNRAFPAKQPGKTLSALLAQWAQDELYSIADFLIDFHGGDANERAMTFAYMPAVAAPSVNEAAREAALCLGLALCVDSSAKNGLYSYANQCNIPSLLIENGGQNSWDEGRVSANIHIATRLMKHLEIVDAQGALHLVKGHDEGLVYLPGDSKRITHSVYEESPCNGWWYPRITEGLCFHKGELLGQILTVSGDVVHEVVAVSDGQVLYYTTALGVCPGEPLVAYGCFET